MGTKVEYYNRTTGEKVTESVMGDGALRFAYETLLGRTLWTVLFGSKLVSAIMGAYYDSPRSKKAIKALVNIPGCKAEEAEFPPEEYPSFNAFFTRKLKPGSRPIGEGVVTPSDGRLMLYMGADSNLAFPLKGATRKLKEVIAETELPEKLDICVIRLAPVDYHRFHFPCDCEIEGETKVIKGKYHSVNPIALIKYPDVYADNERQIVTANSVYGKFWQVDVGAFGVGTIVQTFTGKTHKKGEERGYFKFGGSTVILIFKAGAVKFDADLVRNSLAGVETLVKCGERIAE